MNHYTRIPVDWVSIHSFNFFNFLKTPFCLYQKYLSILTRKTKREVFEINWIFIKQEWMCITELKEEQKELHFIYTKKGIPTCERFVYTSFSFLISPVNTSLQVFILVDLLNFYKQLFIAIRKNKNKNIWWLTIYIYMLLH